MTRNSIKKNFIYNIFYQALVVVIPLITSPYLTRVIGAEGLGVYSFTYTFANYFVLFVLLGVNNYGNREIAKVRDNKSATSRVFWEIYFFQIAMLFVVLSVYILFLIAFIKDNREIYWIQIIYVLSAGLDINWCCFGLEKFKLTVTRNSIIKIVSAVLIFVLVKNRDDLWKYTLLITLSAFISQLVLWPFVLKFVDVVRPTIKGIRRHIKPNIMLFLPVVAVSLYRLMDKLMLGMMDSKREVAFYTYAERFIEIPGVVISALGTVMLPRASHMLSTGQKQESNYLLEKSMQFAMLFSIGASFGIAAISSVFMPWYYGDEFTRCAIFAVWLSPVTVLTSWNNVIRTQFVIPTNRDRVYLITVSVGALVNVAMNAVFIPIYNGIGAVIGTIVAQLMVCVTQFLLTRKDLNYLPFRNDTIAFIIFGGVMMLATLIVPDRSDQVILTIILKVFIGTIVYGALSIIYLVIIKKDISLINAALSLFGKKIER